MKPFWIAIVIVLALFPEGASRSLRSGNRWFSSPEKELGCRIREERGPGQLFVSAKGRTSFYADGKNLPFPSNPLSEIADYLENRGVHFIVIDERRAKRRTPELVEALKTHPRFEEYARAEGKKTAIIAYRYLPRG
ncbi:MAG: hypothetical protein AAF488_01660 [Planctomycetota bacterium]